MGLILEAVAYPSEKVVLNYMSLNAEGYIRYLVKGISLEGSESLKEENFGKYECYCRDCGEIFHSFRNGAKRCPKCWKDKYINAMEYQIHHIRIRNRMGRWEKAWGVIRNVEWETRLLAYFHTKTEAERYADGIKKVLTLQRKHMTQTKDNE